MATIKLDDEFSLETDRFNWILKYSKKSTNDEGKDVTSSWQSYHGKLHFALKEYLDETLKTSKSVEDLQKNLESGLIKIDEACLKVEALSGELAATIERMAERPNFDPDSPAEIISNGVALEDPEIDMDDIL